MKKFYLICSLILITFLLVSCSKFLKKSTPQENLTDLKLEKNLTEPIKGLIDTPKLEENKVIEPISCKTNSECSVGLICIDNKCGTIEDLYQTNCTKKCNFNNVAVLTSDGNTLTLNRGRGDYTAAGAVEWILASGPDYCKTAKTIVPVKLLAKNYGKIINEKYITINAGEKSTVITHPTIKNINFFLTIKSVNETCK